MPAACVNVASPLHPAVALLRRETLVRRGAAPGELDGRAVPEGHYLLRGDAFLMRAAGGIAFFYRRGEGIIAEHPDEADPRDLALWLNGSLYAAVSAINGLMPIHASAVAHQGQVFAFTGPSGAGKSSLAAGLGHEGLPLFCDDTLILDLSGAGPITCLPGHKRLKLWPEGLDLARTASGEQVASDYPKHFAEPPAGVVAEPLPLAELLVLEHGEEPALQPLTAGERIACLHDDHYTADLFAQARALGRAERLALLASIAMRLPMQRFARPFDPARFAQSTAFLTRSIRARHLA